MNSIKDKLFAYDENAINGLKRFLVKHRIIGAPINLLFNSIFVIKRLIRKKSKAVDLTEKELRNNIMIYSHVLEKMMILNNTEQPDKSYLNKIYEWTRQLIIKCSSFDEYACLVGTAIIEKYMPNKIDKVFDPFIAKSSSIKIGKEEGVFLSGGKYVEFLEARSSHRLLKDKIISADIMDKVVDLALNYPSACNRQPCRIIYSTTKEGNEKIKFFIPDSNVKKNISNFLAVVVDESYFQKTDSDGQYLINGGICLYNTQLALNAYGLGTTIFHAPSVLQRRKEFRDLFKLKQTERVVAFIGYGETYDTTITACAFKKDHTNAALKII